jgi:MurNAc alpha-1-phosphate uridylyltransferase
MLPIAILSGGLGTRLGNVTANQPKCLIEVSGKPFLEWQIELLVNSGYTNLVMCISYKHEQIQKFLKSKNNFGVNIALSLDGEKQLGTGGAIKKAQNLLGPKFAVIYGDSYLPINFKEIEEKFLSFNKAACMTVYKNENLFDKSNVEYNGQSVNLYSKQIKTDKMNYIDYGLTYMNVGTLDSYASDEPFDLSEVLQELSLANQLSGFEVKERFYEIGSSQGILDFTHYLNGVYL